MKSNPNSRQFFLFSLSFIVSLFFVTLAMAGQDQNTKTFNLHGFDRLDLGSAFSIVVTKGDFSVKASGKKEDIEELEANVSGNKLKIRFKDTKGWWGKNRKRIDIVISMPTLRGLDLSGASTSKISGFENLSDLDLDISGASNSTIDLKANNIKLDISGASTVILVGSGTSISGEISGATSFRAYDYVVKQVNLDVSGASTAKIYATERINVEASGASSIRYKGTASVRSNTSGASSIKGDS